jgi:hypothetical protein
MNYMSLLERFCMKTGLKEGTTFTLLIDSVVEDVGLIGAAVFGVVYRHCQMRNECCYASQKKMAKLTGTSPRTVSRYLDKLVKLDYIQELGNSETVPEGMMTKKYICTTKAGVKFTGFEQVKTQAKTEANPQVVNNFKDPDFDWM